MTCSAAASSSSPLWWRAPGIRGRVPSSCRAVGCTGCWGLESLRPGSLCRVLTGPASPPGCTWCETEGAWWRNHTCGHPTPSLSLQNECKCYHSTHRTGFTGVQTIYSADEYVHIQAMNTVIMTSETTLQQNIKPTT